MTQPSDSVYPKHSPPGSKKPSPWIQKTSPWIQKTVPLMTLRDPKKCPPMDPKNRPPNFYLKETSKQKVAENNMVVKFNFRQSLFSSTFWLEVSFKYKLGGRFFGSLGGHFFGSLKVLRGTIFWIQGDVFLDPGGRFFGSRGTVFWIHTVTRLGHTFSFFDLFIEIWNVLYIFLSSGNVPQ